MKKTLFLFCGLFTGTLLLAQSAAHLKVKTPSQYVDPYIGTADHGHVFLGANVPFGMVQLGVSDLEQEWDWCSGYNYRSNTMVGFSHTHLSGTGIGDLNDILMMPASGEPSLRPSGKNSIPDGYLSSYSHATEITRPGYYSVLVDKYNVRAELTTTERVGLQRYTYPADETAQVLLNLNYGMGWDRTVIAGLHVVNDSTIAGYRYSTGWAKDQRIYFTAVCSQPLLKARFFQADTLLGTQQGEGTKLQAILSFAVKKGKPLLIKVALSPVSEVNAAKNMAQELPGWNFEAVVKAATAKWDKELGAIRIEAPEKVKTIFYTSLYHTYFGPSLYNDHDGTYLGTDKKVYTDPGFSNYSVFSLWDTYRGLHPLMTLAQPERVNDFVRSFLAIHQQQGRLPVWHLMGNETNTMNGNHSIPVIVDAYRKGIRGYDAETAYQALKATAMQSRDGMNYLQQIHYIPADTLTETVANALEYAIDDWSVAAMAKELGHTEDAAYFSKRAQLYREYFDHNTQFMRGKMIDGSWHIPFDPMLSSHRHDDYTEGNSWQYTWLVPQDPYGLIGLFGGEKPFIKKLDALFSTKAEMGDEASPDISGLIGLYAQGNEPNHHIPYLYAYAGEPWKTAQRIRQIVDTFYTDKPNGLCGNEDLGQMSAWYVLSAMGFYPVNPANGVYVLGSPSVNEAIIPNAGGKAFRLQVMQNSRTNIYIQGALWNGKPWNKSYITHAMIRQGGTLVLKMGPKPSAVWGVAPENRPPQDLPVQKTK